MNLSVQGDAAAAGVPLLLAAAVLAFATQGRDGASEAAGGRAEQGPWARYCD